MNNPSARILPALLLLASGVALSSERSIRFDVYLDERPVGTHQFDIQRDAAGTWQVTSVAAFDVKLLGFTAYRYRHRAEERWRDGCLQQIDSTTDDNGRRSQVARKMQEGCISSYAYWDPAVLLRQTQLLNPQTGEIDAVRIEGLGEESIQVRGATLRADHYRIGSAKLTIDLWYSKQGEWLQLESTTGSQRKLRYRLAQR